MFSFIQLIAKVYLHYKHIDWAAEELRKVVSSSPSTSWTSNVKPPDTEAMLLLAGKKDVFFFSGSLHRQPSVPFAGCSVLSTTAFIFCTARLHHVISLKYCLDKYVDSSRIEREERLFQ